MAKIVDLSPEQQSFANCRTILATVESKYGGEAAILCTCHMLDAAGRILMRGVQDLKIESAMIMVCLLAFQPGARGEEQRVHAQVGSFWNYEVADQIKGTKAIMEETLSEVNGDQLVLRTNRRGQAAGQTLWVHDKSWNVIEAPSVSVSGLLIQRGVKFQPNNGQGVPEPLEVGSKSKKKITSSRLLASGWSDPRPMMVEATIVSIETTSTQAGEFETYRFEVTSTNESPTQPPSVTTSKNVYWFSPQIDHWVRAEHEVRTDEHVIAKNSSELIGYQVK